jgi:hypothetical protein
MHIEPPTPRTGRAVGAPRGAIVAATALACTALISACGSSSSTPAKTNVDTQRVALSIEQSILAKRHLHATVSCPPTVPAEKGKTFVCIATVPNAKNPSTVTKTPFTVTVQSSRGYVTYVGAGA